MQCTPKEIGKVSIPDTSLPTTHPLLTWNNSTIEYPLQDILTLSPVQLQQLSIYMQQLENNTSTL